MNLFRSKDCACPSAVFEARMAAGLLSFEDVMRIMRTPRHRGRLSGRYVSAATGYLAAFVDRLREVTRGSEFWGPAL